MCRLLNMVNLWICIWIALLLSEANIETYRTPDYMLSCALDYRKGAPGYQQHIWQATLGNKALVYTNHPGGKNLRWSPNYWAGNEILPRAAQSKNVVICIYNTPANQKNDFPMLISR